MAQALRAKAAAKKLGVCNTKFYEMLREGELPPATPISGRVKVWFEDELDAFLESRRTAARTESTKSGAL